MPAPIESFIETPTLTHVRVGLAPAHNALYSLLLLTETEKLSGLGDWVVKTANQLTPEERQQHYRVMIGFYHAIMPQRDWSSFPAYLNHLEDMDPQVLQDKLMDSYCELSTENADHPVLDKQSALASPENYVTFLLQRFCESRVDLELERWAYGYAIDPPALQELIVTHLRNMWDKYLRAEWDRVLPSLQKVVNAFSDVDFKEMDSCEAAKYVLGQSMADEYLQDKCEEVEALYFIPSMHVGPYLGKIRIENYHGFIFGARLPENLASIAPEVSLADIYVRVNALADETRLQILSYIAAEGESCSTDIIDALNLSQSAASRHLTQLTAVGYLVARRKDSAKCYQLDDERILNTLDTLKSFLHINNSKRPVHAPY